MGPPAVREVVLVPFPYSDLSHAKVRPAICLADAQRGDWLVCQVTSSPYGDPTAISIGGADFETGGLRIHSFARPVKLFTVHYSTFIKSIGKLNDATFQSIVARIIQALRP